MHKHMHRYRHKHMHIICQCPLSGCLLASPARLHLCLNLRMAMAAVVALNDVINDIIVLVNMEAVLGVSVLTASKCMCVGGT